MVLKEFLTRELTKKAVGEKQLMWEAWNKRREEFEEENPDKKFPEPPPSSGELTMLSRKAPVDAGASFYA